jgi:hypothetical protein
VESATANGLTVQVSLQDTGWKLHASVAVSNGSNSQVFVLPSLVTLDELTPSLRNLREENPAKLARHEVNHQLMHSESTAVPPPSAIVLRSRAAALKAAKLAPSEKTAGELWFARDSNAHELSLRISVGDVVFDFPFSFE